MDLGAQIELISQANSIDEAFEKYCQIISSYGYDRVVYSLMNDHPSLDLPKQHGLVSSYPDSWVNHYNQSSYMEHDPVAHELMQTIKPFYWDDLLKRKHVSKISQQVMNEAKESRICDGLAFSMPGNFGEVTAFGLARTKSQADRSKDYQTLASLHLLSVYFHDVYRGFHKTKQYTPLSKREIDVLQWASEGKTDDVISSLMNISLNTVRFHWKNIFQKLEAHGRVFAVSKAIRLELIKPVFIKSTYQKR